MRACIAHVRHPASFLAQIALGHEPLDEISAFVVTVIGEFKVYRCRFLHLGAGPLWHLALDLRLANWFLLKRLLFNLRLYFLRRRLFASHDHHLVWSRR